MGSHDVALDVVVGALADRGFSARTLAVGSLGGVAAASRGECDIAPVHLIDPASGQYNEHLVTPRPHRWCRAGGACRASCSGRAIRVSRAATRTRRSRPRSPTVRADGQSQCRRRHARADRQVCSKARGRPATPISRNRTTRSRPRSRRAAPTGASPSSRWRNSTASASWRWRRSITIFCWLRAGGERPAVQAFLAALRDDGDARAHPRPRHAIAHDAHGSNVFASLLLLLPLAARRGAGAIARPWRAGARAGDLARRQARGVRQLRHLGDPLVARAQRRRAGDALSRRRGECGRLSARTGASSPPARTRISRSGRRASRSPTRCSTATPRRSSALAVSPDGTRSRPRHGITPCGCGRSTGGAPRVLEGHSAERQRRRLLARRHARGERGLRRDACASGRSTAAAEIIRTLPTPLNAVAVAPDGEIVAAGANGKVYFLSPQGRAARRSRGLRHRRSSPLRSRPTASWSPPPASAARWR